jgi:hypothetical protein
LKRRFKMKTRIAVALGSAVLLATVFGIAQAAPMIRADIPFPFQVEGKTLPAGVYDFAPSQSEEAIQVFSVKKGPSADALVLTRMGGEIHTTTEDSHVVFDKIGQTYILSELWLPYADGYLLHATKEKHQHRTVSVKS